MKIAMMTNSYKPYVAGVPISIERLAQGLRYLGHQVVIFAPGYEGQEEEPDVIRCSSLLQGVVCGFSVPNPLDPKIEREFRAGAFDLIHVHQPMVMGHTAQYLAGKYKVPLVLTYHTRYEEYLHYIGLSGLRGFMPLYLKNYFRQCRLVFAPTPLVRDYLEGIQRCVPVSVLPTGLPKESFAPDEKEAMRIRQKLLAGRQETGKRYLFCTVTRLAKEKNLEFLLRSLQIAKSRCGSFFHLALVGEGPFRRKLEKLTGKLGLQDEVTFTGEVPNREVKNYCRAADLFLFPSRSETQGIVLLESMAVGTPVLAVQATGTESLVKGGVNGYMTDMSEEAFAEKLMDVLEKRELDGLREGALRTAYAYDSIEIARRAQDAYMQVIEAIYKKREEMWRGSLPYFDSGGR